MISDFMSLYITVLKREGNSAQHKSSAYNSDLVDEVYSVKKVQSRAAQTVPVVASLSFTRGSHIVAICCVGRATDRRRAPGLFTNFAIVCLPDACIKSYLRFLPQT